MSMANTSTTVHRRRGAVSTMTAQPEVSTNAMPTTAAHATNGADPSTVTDEQPQETLATATRPHETRSLTISTTVEATQSVLLSPLTPGRLTTPKKKWMQLWSLQHATGDASESFVTSDDSPVVKTAMLTASDESSLQEQSVVPTEEPMSVDEELTSTESVLKDPIVGQVSVDNMVIVAKTPAEDGEVMSDTEAGEVFQPVTSTNTGAGLRVTMPASAVTSAFSPAGDLASATSTISPSAKVKDTDNTNAKPHSSPTQGKVLVKAASTSQLFDSKGIKRTIEDAGVSTKEAEEDFELTESEKLRLERRRSKKSKWDEGDPRKHGGSLDLAALNLLSSTSTPASHPASFARFPRQRPVYRHSHSMDSKESPFQHRSSFRASVQSALGHHSSQSPPASLPAVPLPRRPFHQSSSLPLERSRNPPRPSSRYLPSN